MALEDPHLSDHDLLLALDGELPTRRADAVQTHLQACWACRKRRAEVESNINAFIGTYQSLLDRRIPPPDSSGLRAILRPSSATPQPWTGKRLTWAVAALLLLICGFGLMRRSRHDLTTPDPRLTPGEAMAASKQQLCQARTGSENGPVPEDLRQAVFAEYGLAGTRRDAYEIDYLITPGLGGSASLRNLWPQPYSKREWNAYAKDALEKRMHSLVCKGALDLSVAQREIATDWVTAYKKYIGKN